MEELSGAQIMIQGSCWQLNHNSFWATNKQTKFSEPHKLLQSLGINNKKKNSVVASGSAGLSFSTRTFFQTKQAPVNSQ